MSKNTFWRKTTGKSCPIKDKLSVRVINPSDSVTFVADIKRVRIFQGIYYGMAMGRIPVMSDNSRLWRVIV